MSFAEILVILLVALIVLGPKRLPEIAYWLGRTLRLLQQGRANLQKIVNEQVKRAELEYNETRAKMAEHQPAKAKIESDAEHETEPR